MSRIKVISCEKAEGRLKEIYDQLMGSRGKLARMEEILTAREWAICRFSTHLTGHPKAHEDKDYTGTLKEAGLSDAGILDVVLVTAYFNFVNRIVLSLGVKLETDQGAGYKY